MLTFYATIAKEHLDAGGPPAIRLFKTPQDAGGAGVLSGCPDFTVFQVDLKEVVRFEEVTDEEGQGHA